MKEQRSDTPRPSEDEGLRCPNCGYNLTGLDEDRCPECGNAFDRDDLRRRSVNEPCPIPSWHEYTLVGNVIGFARTLYWTALKPGEFAREFPQRHPPAVVWAHTIACDIIALGIAIAVRGPDPGTLIFVPSALVAGTLVEMTLALIFSVGIGARGLPQQECYQFWRGIMHCLGGFLIVTIAGWTIVSGNLGQQWSVIGEGTLAASVFWWTGSLLICAAVRGEKARSLLVFFGLVVSIGLVAGTAIWFAVIAGIVVSLLLGIGP